ncbi:MAG: GHKL domain-containing protein [Prevotellaceae bacterium]|jgi:signal transduction histidine kinase|nr:GHKL domain-containing protein [Prevotellaceae bacterium]
MKIITRYKSALWFAVFALAFFVAAKTFFGIYEVSPRYVVNIRKFQKVFSQKEAQAMQTLANFEKQIERDSTLSSLEMPDFQGNEIIYYVYKNNRIAFWSNNQIVPNNGIDFQENTTKYIKMPNNNCVYICRSHGDVKFVALILLKYSYSTETETLRNSFVSEFRTNANVAIMQGNVEDIYSVKDVNGNYLFSLQMPVKPIFNNAWLLASYFAFLLFFIVFYAGYALIPKFSGKKNISPQNFSLLALLFGFLTFLIMYYQAPEGFFGGATLLFNGYAAGNFWKNTGVLSVFTFYCISTFYLLGFVDTAAFFRRYKLAIAPGQLLFFGCFLLFHSILSNIVLNSAMQISILKLDDFTFTRFLMYLLFALWGVGFIFLFFKLFAWVETARDYLVVVIVNLIFLGAFLLYSSVFQRPFAALLCGSFAIFLTMFLFALHFNKSLYIYSNMLNIIYIFIMTGLIALSIFYLEKENRTKYFRMIAENILSTNADQTQSQQAQLVKLGVQIDDDPMLKKLVGDRNLTYEAERYFEEKYLTDNLTNYEATIAVYRKNSVDVNNYINLINEYGSQIALSAFYQISSPENTSSFVGIFDIDTELSLVLNLEPARGFRSYSFPDILIGNDKKENTNQKIATAKYLDGNLSESSGRLVYPSTTSWLTGVSSEGGEFLYNGRHNYVFREKDGSAVAVVTDLQNHKWGNYVIYFSYGFMICYLIVWLFVWLLKVLRHKHVKINIISRFQRLFFVLFLLSFIGVFTLSSEFLKRRYREQQIDSIDEKMTYIQRVLQEKYFYTLTLTNAVASSLADDLQYLAYTFQTDIHVYDNDGMLIATTQPTIFNKNLISRRVAPEIFFADKTTLNKKEKISTLNYLINYSEFFNGDNLQIGYISIPQYFSEIDLNSELQNFLMFIVHIYIIALIVSLIFTNIIQRQLSKPLLDLENKLRVMRLGKRNEKIEYKANDEISQLVEQYNITVEELDRSARLLAKSEREGAWKLMARQIAHEINNPLTPMKLSIQQLQRTKQIGGMQFDNYFDKSTKILVEQIDNLSRIASTFSDFAKAPEAKFERTNLTEKIGSVAELFKNNDKGVIINYLFAEKELYVFADPEQLQQVFNNLIKNAIQAIPEQPQKSVDIELKRVENKVVVTVTDNGSGIAPEIADKLFVPSFTTKSTGTGLGLAISKSIIETAGGTIAFTSKANKGTTFKVELPAL